MTEPYDAGPREVFPVQLEHDQARDWTDFRPVRGVVEPNPKAGTAAGVMEPVEAIHPSVKTQTSAPASPPGEAAPTLDKVTTPPVAPEAVEPEQPVVPQDWMEGTDEIFGDRTGD